MECRATCGQAGVSAFGMPSYLRASGGLGIWNAELRAGKLGSRHWNAELRAGKLEMRPGSIARSKTGGYGVMR